MLGLKKVLCRCEYRQPELWLREGVDIPSEERRDRLPLGLAKARRSVSQSDSLDFLFTLWGLGAWEEGTALNSYFLLKV